VSISIIIALIALAGSIFSTIATTFGIPAVQAHRDSSKLLDAYREPLIAASYELQARLYNILRLGFIDVYVADDAMGKQDAAIVSTLYVFAQFFGWRELIRRDVHYIKFARDRQTREFAQLLSEISDTFLSDQYGTQFMIWRVEQRGLGERMAETSNSKLGCLGYASFIEHRTEMGQWLDSIEQDLKKIDEGGQRRLTQIQHLLVELVGRLDDKCVQYPSRLERA
jgi:hypothetical protein